MISAIILSAGLSQRFGEPKALAPILGTTVIRYLQDNLLKTSVDEIIIVLGHEAKRIEPHLLNHTRIKVVYNKNYNFGQTSSFQAGLRELSLSSSGVFLFPVDTPLIKIETVNKIVHAFSKNSFHIIIPTYKNQKGHPPLFSIQFKEDFLNLSVDEGINKIAKDNKENVELLAMDDPGVVCTFNTRDEWEVLKKEYNL
jgi:CTP:molybdopterin cytidylyltransferase MocA